MFAKQTRRWAKRSISDIAHRYSESFLFYCIADINIESFRPPFSKGGEGGGASSPSKTVFLFYLAFLFAPFASKRKAGKNFYVVYGYVRANKFLQTL